MLRHGALPIQEATRYGLIYSCRVNGGGHANLASGSVAVVGGGLYDNAAGISSTVSGGSSAGYQVTGVIRNIGGATAFVGTPIKTVLGENNAAWDVQVEADDGLDALVVKVQGSSGTTIRWVASARTVEVGR